MARRVPRQFDHSDTRAHPAPHGVTRLVLLAALAGCCAAVLYARTYVDFERIRIRVVTTAQPAVDGRITVPLPRAPKLAGQPASVVLRLENHANASRAVAVTVDGAEVARTTLGPAREARVDLRLAAGVQRADGGTLELASRDDGWSLHLLELGNAYGFSSGPFSFVIVPTATHDYRSVPAWAAALAGLGLLLVALPWFHRLRSRALRIAHRVVVAVILTVFLVALLWPAAAIYTILLSTRAFVWCLVLLYLPVLDALYVRARPRLVPALAASGRLAAAAAAVVHAHRFRALSLGAVGVFLVSVSGFYDGRTGFTSLIAFGAQFNVQSLPALRSVPRVVGSTSGYDGQFYAQLALDPLTTEPSIERALDNFAYRARRILFSWTAYVLGLGQPRWVVQAYAVQNILAWLLLAVLLRRWLPLTSSRTLLAWVGCLFSHGLIMSVTHALLEGPSLLLVVLAVMAIERSRPWLAAGLIGLSGLGRETNVLSAGVLIRALPRLRALPGLAAQALVVGAPLALWLAYLRLSHPNAPFDLGSSGNFAAPLTGYLLDWRGTIAGLGAEGWNSVSRFDLLALVSLTVQVGFFAIRRDWRDPWYRVGLTYGILMIVLGPALWEGAPGAYTRVLLPMTCAFNVLVVRVAGPFYWPLVALGNLTVLHGLEVLQTPYIWMYL
jgi:hypothetical protein